MAVWDGIPCRGRRRGAGEIDVVELLDKSVELFGLIERSVRGRTNLRGRALDCAGRAKVTIQILGPELHLFLPIFFLDEGVGVVEVDLIDLLIERRRKG